MRASAVALLLLVAFCQPAQAAATLDTVTTTSVYGCLRTNGAGVYDTTGAALNLTHCNAYHDYPVLTQLGDGRLAIFRATAVST